MDLLVVLSIIGFGVACLWAAREHQERLIAKKGYKHYIQFSPRWRKKRKACYKAYGYRCALCNSPHNLQAHHRSYRNLYNEKPGDLVALCANCHSRYAPKSAGLFKP